MFWNNCNNGSAVCQTFPSLNSERWFPMRFAFTCPRLVANFLYGFWFQVAVLSMSIPSRNNEPQAIKKTCSWCENTSYIMNSPAYTSKVRAMSPDAISVGAELMGYELTFIDGDHTHNTHTHISRPLQLCIVNVCHSCSHTNQWPPQTMMIDLCVTELARSWRLDIYIVGMSWLDIVLRLSSDFQHFRVTQLDMNPTHEVWTHLTLW